MLTAVKGIGEWSSHMFLMFTLHRPDVLGRWVTSGARNAAMRAYDLPAPPKGRGAGRRSPSPGGPTAHAPAR